MNIKPFEKSGRNKRILNAIRFGEKKTTQNIGLNDDSSLVSGQAIRETVSDVKKNNDVH